MTEHLELGSRFSSLFGAPLVSFRGSRQPHSVDSSPIGSRAFHHTIFFRYPLQGLLVQGKSAWSRLDLNSIMSACRASSRLLALCLVEEVRPGYAIDAFGTPGFRISLFTCSVGPTSRTDTTSCKENDQSFALTAPDRIHSAGHTGTKNSVWLRCNHRSSVTSR